MFNESCGVACQSLNRLGLVFSGKKDLQLQEIAFVLSTYRNRSNLLYLCVSSSKSNRRSTAVSPPKMINPDTTLVFLSSNGNYDNSTHVPVSGVDSFLQLAEEYKLWHKNMACPTRHRAFAWMKRDASHLEIVRFA